MDNIDSICILVKGNQSCLMCCLYCAELMVEQAEFSFFFGGGDIPYHQPHLKGLTHYWPVVDGASPVVRLQWRQQMNGRKGGKAGGEGRSRARLVMTAVIYGSFSH